LGPAEAPGASRASRLFPGTTLVHADMHNHSLFSDGDGDPAAAFGSMRGAGLDVAALTDHSTVSYGLSESPCGGNGGCQGLAGINEASWEAARGLADALNADGSFVGIRGFEWSSPTLGHINVWLSERWTDPLHTAGTSTGEGLAQFAHDGGADQLGDELHQLDALVRQAPTTGAGMALFYQWLASDPARPGLGGGLDGIAGFNHPGREPGRYSSFRFEPAVVDRLVSLEIFNRSEDYLFEGTDSGYPSPLVDCLNAGWRVGLLGVTDEHGTSWGTPLGKGRGGLWVTDLSRAGVKQAMLDRRFFATRERGLRLDAAAAGVRMGRPLSHASGAVRFEVDLDQGPPSWGRPVAVQVLRPDAVLPQVVANVEAEIPVSEGEHRQPVISFEVPIDRADGGWVTLRVTDPKGEPDGRANPEWRSYGRALAYTSPWYLQA
ncbi:MAG TPA: hypothetical protein VGB51_06950, partial [Actinomycetota bacterium]